MTARPFKAGLSFLIFIALIAAWGAPAWAGPRTVAVVGVENQIDRPEWEDQLIGEGLAHLLLQELFDTGKFIPLEDNPEIIRRLDSLVLLQWKGEAPPMEAKAAESLAREFNTDAVAWIRAYKFSTSRSRSFAGPLSSSKTTVKVKVEVFLKEKGQPVRSAKGKGKAKTKSMGVFFQVHKDKIYFDETTVGQAAKEAVRRAVEGLKIK